MTTIAWSVQMRRPASKLGSAHLPAVQGQAVCDAWIQTTSVQGLWPTTQLGMCAAPKVLGLCEPTTGIAPFHRLVDLVMSQEPYSSARRVFWVTDNGSSHRGLASARRLASWYRSAIQVPTPVHASWLNQVEVYFPVVQREVLKPNEIEDLDILRQRLLDFQAYYEKVAKPFEWEFTRADLHSLLAQLQWHPSLSTAAAT